MNLFLNSFYLICLFSCSGQYIDNNTIEQSSFGSKNLVLEGHWKFVSAVKVEDTPFLTHYPNPNTPAREEGPPNPPYIGPDLIFENDTMYEVDYPTVLSSRNNFSVKSGYLHHHFKGYMESFPVEFVKDTLFVYKPFYGKKYVKEGYVKTSFNDSIVTLLKREGVNFPELAGTWHLIRRASVGDGSEYLLTFQYKIPDSIKITREDFITGLKNNKVYLMSTGGKKRDYVFSYHWGYLELTPGKWYEGEEQWIHYTRNKMEN
jgi:hypothetical protein